MLTPILLALTMTSIPAGVVTHHAGHSTLFRPNAQLVSTATSGQLIHFGDAIETSENGYIELFIGFILFRFFDISKIWPICFFDHKKNTFGIISDDICAGIMSAIILFSILFYI